MLSYAVYDACLSVAGIVTDNSWDCSIMRHRILLHAGVLHIIAASAFIIDAGYTYSSRVYRYVGLPPLAH